MFRTLILIAVISTPALGQDSPHGPLKLPCTTCHVTDSWTRNAGAGFDHSSTGFALDGQHQATPCIACHKDLVFQSVSSDCQSCHTDVHRQDLGENCQRCHTTDAWRVDNMVQKHSATRFPLIGRHATAECADCHEASQEHRYSGSSTDCMGCHRIDYQNTNNPNHIAAGFPVQCDACHMVSDMQWTGLNLAVTGFDHSITGFAMTGAHKSVNCASCHKNDQFVALDQDCFSCHSADYAGAANPVHTNFDHNCASCHTTMAWRPASPTSFDHSTTAFGFAWTAKHATAACEDCHTAGNYALRFNDCYQCHAADFTISTNPNHVTGNLVHDCTQCHALTGWKPATFNHATTGFPLTGAHVAVVCADCHTNGNFATLSYVDCYACHSSDFTGVVDPDHVSGNYSHDCTSCHTTTAWKPASVTSFDHTTTPFGFAWSGKHLTATCADCHTNANYSLKYTDCYACHSADFARPANPSHVTGNLSHDCTSCHSFTSFTPSTFNHATATKFALTGAHMALPCSDCHTNGNYRTLVYTDCYPCHTADYAGVVNPNHVSGNYAHDCSSCHSTAAWKPASVSSFDHTATPFGFAWTGPHVTAPCENCHTNGNYSLQYTDCYVCHSADFAVPTNPNHVTGNLSHDCTSCHSVGAWKPSTFNHSTTGFPLAGAHTTTPCQSCHANGNYTTLTYTDCYACHATDFAGTLDPAHVSGNFSHDCTKCHSTSVWKPSTFNHATTAFPLTGAHTTTPCQSCHTNGNYTTLTYTDCYACHSSDFAGTLDPAHVSGNFSHDCTKCHSTSVWKPSTFNHSTTAFPLTGAHITTPCQSCHTNGNYTTLMYADCYACHSSDFAGASNPNHVAGNFDHDCTRCHSTTSWGSATFDHSTTAFPLTGAHVSVSCETCHTNGNYALTYTDCYPCHTADFALPTNPNHVTSGFSHTCAPCHTTAAWLPATFNHSWFRITTTRHNVPCSQCHQVPTDYTQFNCQYACHSRAHHSGEPCWPCHRS